MDAPLVLLGPAMIADPRSGEVDDGVEPAQLRRIEHAALRGPTRSRPGSGGDARTAPPRVRASRRCRGERAADQPGCAGDADSHGHRTIHARPQARPPRTRLIGEYHPPEYERSSSPTWIWSNAMDDSPWMPPTPGSPPSLTFRRAATPPAPPALAPPPPPPPPASPWARQEFEPPAGPLPAEGPLVETVDTEQARKPRRSKVVLAGSGRRRPCSRRRRRVRRLTVHRRRRGRRRQPERARHGARSRRSRTRTCSA